MRSRWGRAASYGDARRKISQLTRSVLQWGCRGRWFKLAPVTLRGTHLPCTQVPGSAGDSYRPDLEIFGPLGCDMRGQNGLFILFRLGVALAHLFVL